jgi:hypothetical protein
MHELVRKAGEVYVKILHISGETEIYFENKAKITFLHILMEVHQTHF